MESPRHSRVAIACQGGGSHTAFTAGVLDELLNHLPEEVDLVALSGTSGGAICAALAWDGLLRAEPERSSQQLQRFWGSVAASEPWDLVLNHTMQNLVNLRNCMVLPEVSPYAFPPWGLERMRDILNGLLDFEELRAAGPPTRRSGSADWRRGGPHRLLRGFPG